jgi:Domain of unknown function (DUF4234)
MASHPIAFNPYASPQSNVDIDGVRGSILNFPRFSAWFVLFLTWLTLGIYQVYWVYTRGRITNRILPGGGVPLGLTIALVILFCANLVVSFASGANPENDHLQMLRFLFGVAQWIVHLVWIFTFRDVLREISNKPAVSGVMTFFFSQLYFQYKINEFIDELHQGEISLGETTPAANEAAA